MQPYLIEAIKELDVAISKSLFKEAKLQDIKRPPSPLQARILKYILEHKEGVILQKHLEEELRVSKATISEVLTSMEKREIIKRVGIQEDARAKRIVLTNTSLARFEELKQNLLTINERLVSGLTDKELAQFLSILHKMLDNMKEKGE